VLLLGLDFIPITGAGVVKNGQVLFAVLAPILVIASFGLYALCSVLYGVFTFNDCPEAREELVNEIKQAKVELRKRNII